MKAGNLETITRHWSISGTTPNPDQSHPNYGQNFLIGVEAGSMEEAIELAREVYDDATFLNCSHRGDIHLRSREVTRQ